MINYTREQGLPFDLVKCTYQDNSGQIWFGTSGGGASRYNPDPSIKEVKKLRLDYDKISKKKIP